MEVGNQHVNVEASEHEAVEVFGTYQSIEDELVESQDDYMLTEEKGDTLYITLKDLPKVSGFFSYQPLTRPTILVPAQSSSFQYNNEIMNLFVTEVFFFKQKTAYEITV